MAELRAWYYVYELAMMANVPRDRLLNMVKQAHPRLLYKNKGGYYVYLWDLQKDMKKLWNSILEMESLRFKMGLRSVVVRPEPHDKPPEDAKEVGK